MDTIGIARTGLAASMTRLTASASNIASASVTGSATGGQAGPRPYQPVRAEISALAGGGVQARLVPDGSAGRLVHDPAAPYADMQGLVLAPAVDVTHELVEQLAAKLAFEANLKLVGTVSDLQRSTLQLWG